MSASDVCLQRKWVDSIDGPQYHSVIALWGLLEIEQLTSNATGAKKQHKWDINKDTKAIYPFLRLHQSMYIPSLYEKNSALILTKSMTYCLSNSLRENELEPDRKI